MLQCSVGRNRTSGKCLVVAVWQLYLKVKLILLSDFEEKSLKMPVSVVCIH